MMLGSQEASAGPGVPLGLTAPGLCRALAGWQESQLPHLYRGPTAGGHRARPAPRMEQGIVRDLPGTAIVWVS